VYDRIGLMAHFVRRPNESNLAIIDDRDTVGDAKG